MVTLENRTCVICDAPIAASKRIHAVYCSNTCGGKKRNRSYQRSNPEKILLGRERQNMNAERRIYNRIKSRAKKYGISFDLDHADIVIPTICPVLGIDIVRYHGTGKPTGFMPNSASVDRINPNKGYVKGNIRVISARANLLKSNAEVWELEAVLKDLRICQKS